MTSGRHEGRRHTGQRAVGRLAARRRAGVGLALLGAAVTALALPAPPAAADRGSAQIRMTHPTGVYRYGDAVRFLGEVEDTSWSCGFTDCDRPSGTVTLRRDGNAINTIHVVPSIIAGFSDFYYTVPGGIPAGDHTASASFRGDFTVLVPAETSFRIDPRPCNTVLTQDRAASGPGDQVTFTADVSDADAPAQGTVSFYQDDGTGALDIFLGSGTVDPVTNTASLTIVAGLLPLGATTDVYGVFTSANANHQSDCRSNDVAQTVVASPPPTAQDDRYSTVRGQPITFDILANDSSGNGQPYGNIEIVDDVDHGERSGEPASMTYTPEDGYVGDDSFTYFVRSSEGAESATATVNIIVSCTPTAGIDTYTTAFGTALTVDGSTRPSVLANDDTCEEAAELATQPEHGTLSGFSGANGTFTYTPDAGYSGLDSFTYRYTTGPAIDSVATVHLSVGSNAPPLTPDEAWIVQVYETFLDRAPDDAGLAYWVDRLGSGTTRAAVLRSFAFGNEATRGPVVTDLYDRLLDRAPDAAERLYWGDMLMDGTRYHWVERTLLASDERYTASGGTDAAYVADLYERILGRTGSGAEIAYWVGRLGSGEQRLNTVDALLNTPEARGFRVAQVAESVLDRPATAGEATELGAIYKASRDPRKVAAAAFLLRD